jgi:nucleoside-diphosphate-sugar epimerase
LVSIENVTQAIMHLALTDMNIDGELYYISDDDQKKNNYRDVETLLRKHLNVPDYSIPIVPLPPILLSIALRLLGRSNINPFRVYSSEKLKATGYKRHIRIEGGIALFAKWYKQEILQR